MTLLGELYANGLGVPQNDAKAAEWYQLAAARGDREAMFALAMFRLRGRAGARRPRRQRQMARRRSQARPRGRGVRSGAAVHRGTAVSAGFPPRRRTVAGRGAGGQFGSAVRARHVLQGGPRCAEGPKGVRAAVGAAALADNIDAEVEYAIALFNGEGVPKNEEAAAALFRKAAKQGSPIAQDRLARILSEGRGAPKNPVEATKWHLISKAHGETNIPLDDFVDRLDSATRTAGEKAAQPWLDAIKRPRIVGTQRLWQITPRGPFHPALRSGEGDRPKGGGSGDSSDVSPMPHAPSTMLRMVPPPPLRGRMSRREA